MVVNVELDAAYRRYYPVIRHKCARMLRDKDAAEDVAQETFIRLWKHTPDNVLAWIYATSTRLAIDHLRARRKRVEGDVAVVMRFDETMDARAWLERAARKLPARELEAVVLHRVDGLSQPEVASVMQSSERTVRRLLAKFDGRAK